jgi:proliferating cell nuclear antigen
LENTKTQRTTEFNLNLITIDSEHLAIPETEYTSLIQINSAEFTKICKELFSLSETVSIATNPDYVQFSVDSDIGAGAVKIGQNDSDKKDEMTTLEVSENVN